MFVGALLLASLAFIPVALADGSTFLSGLLQALNATGLGQFANETASLNCTTIGQSVLAQLSQGNKTIFAPTDRALSSVNSSVISNQTSLAELIAYHIVSGNFVNQTQTYPNVTIGRTLLNDSTLVTLEGNKSQVLVWSKTTNGTYFVQNQGTNVTVVNATTYYNTTILAIDSVLIPPPNISTICNNASYNLSTLAGILQSTTFQNISQQASQSNYSLLDLLSAAHGITVFAPNNAGIQAAQSSLAGLSGNTTALKNVLSNHVINGTTIYSTEVSNKTTFVSAGGENYAFFSNSTGLFVSVGGSNAVQIVQTNVLTSNGVMHIVNGVMLDTHSNPSAASSAYAAATSLAALTSTQIGPIASSTSAHVSAAKSRINNWRLGAVLLAVGFIQLV